MQQLCITLMAVLGMIVPVVNRKLESFLQMPRVRQASQRLLLAIAQCARPAAVASVASHAIELAAGPDIMTAMSAAARRFYLNVATAAFWRGADVDKPCSRQQSSDGEQTGARLAGLLCVLDRRSSCNC
ncbi:MAG: hypothetical protein V4631_23075 [Pseudomonadota bacterium]